MSYLIIKDDLNYQDTDFTPDPEFGVYEDADISSSMEDRPTPRQVGSMADEKVAALLEWNRKQAEEMLRVQTYYEQHPLRAMLKGIFRMSI